MKAVGWLAALICFVVAGIWLARPKNVQYYDIAVIGPMSGTYQEIGQMMRKGAELAIAEGNQRLANSDVRLRLQVLDDESDPQSRYRPQELAGELVRNPRLLAVVGHAFSTPSRVAAPVYAKLGLPVISPLASHPDLTTDRPSHFSMVLSDPQQGVLLANYALNALGRKRVAVIMAAQDQGALLGQAFIDALADNAVAPLRTIALSDTQRLDAALAGELEPLRGAELILLALPAEQAARVAGYLRVKQIKADFIGGEEIGSARYLAEAGIAAERTYALRSFLPELLGRGGRQFVQSFRDQYLQLPGSTAANSYEAVQLLVEAIRQEGADRERIQRFLAGLRNAERAFPSISGGIHFDKNGVNQRIAGIGRVEQGNYVAAEYQIVPVQHVELARLKDERPIQINDQWIKQSTVMYTGMRVARISELNVVTGRYKADFDVWFRWQGREHPNIDFELANGAILQRTEIERHVDATTGEHYLAYRVEAMFQQEFDLRDYPFDVQTLKIQVVPKNLATEEVMLVKDLGDRNPLAKALALGVWVDGGHQEYVDQDQFVATFRNPRFDKVTYELKHSVFNYDIKIQRKVLQYMIKLIPLLVVMLAAYLSFFLDVASALAPRLSVSITALLSAVAFHMSQSSASNIGYLIKADYFFMLTYWLIFFTLAEAIVSKHLQVTGRAAASTRLDYNCSWIYLVIIVVAILVMVVW